jgi:hypothetical protein
MWQLFRSSRGIDARRVLLDEWRRRAEPLRSSVIRADGGMNAEDAARVAALYGAGFLTLGAYASVAPMIGALTPPAELTIGKEKSASVGCGGTTSSCGSDSGGGGGGGCGGGGCGGCGGGGD